MRHGQMVFVYTCNEIIRTFRIGDLQPIKGIYTSFEFMTENIVILFSQQNINVDQLCDVSLKKIKINQIILSNK